MRVRRHGKSWQARWYDARTPKVRAKSFRTKREAERYATRMEAAIHAGDYVDPSLGKVTLATWWTRFLDSQPHLAPNTRRQYGIMWRNHIEPRLGHRRLNSLTRLDRTRGCARGRRP